MQKNKFLAVHKLLFALLVLCLSFSVFAADNDEDEMPFEPFIPKSAGSKCVLPEDEMRKVHPDLLKHDRISTLRHGIRAKSDGKALDGSLKGCISCHAYKKDGQYVRISSKEHFCATCHVYVGASLDCFQCHRDIPEE